MPVKIEHTVAGHNHDILQQYTLMFMPAEVWGLKESKNSQNVCMLLSIETYLHSRKMKIKINFDEFIVIFHL